MRFNNNSRMFQDDLLNSLTGEQYDTQVPMRRPEQAQNPRMEALRGIASRVPENTSQQELQPERKNISMEDLIHNFGAKSLDENLSAGKGVGLGVNTDATNANTYADAKELIDDKKKNNPQDSAMAKGRYVPEVGIAASKDKKEDNSKMAGAMSSLGKALAGPTEAINVGQYSTFRPEDTMADIRKQVLESIRARG
jgi:hypothetical protein